MDILDKIFNANKGQQVNPLAYSTIINDIRRFRHDDKKRSFDQPGNFYFKILFYFENTPEDYSEADKNYASYKTSNLLGSEYDINTALYYLKANRQIERFNYLKRFINLLSEINTECPWYFQSISGLNEVLNKKQISGEIKIEPERKSITIGFLPETVDNRIGTLFDLYKAACFSYVNKKEILPANLRKFDMGIYIFPQQMIYNINNGDSYMSAGPVAESNNSAVRMGCKYIELQGCEFDITSFNEPFATLNNNDANQFTYNIKINIDDAYESRYNEFLLDNIGDFVQLDFLSRSASDINADMASLEFQRDAILGTDDFNMDGFSDEEKNRIAQSNTNAQSTLNTQRNMLRSRYDAVTNSNIATQLVGEAAGFVKNKLKSVVLGNFYGFSPKNLYDNVGNLGLNTIGEVRRGVDQLIDKNKKPKSIPKGSKLPGYVDQKRAASDNRAARNNI